MAAKKTTMSEGLSTGSEVNPVTKKISADATAKVAMEETLKRSARVIMEIGTKMDTATIPKNRALDIDTWLSTKLCNSVDSPNTAANMPTATEARKPHSTFLNRPEIRKFALCSARS